MQIKEALKKTFTIINFSSKKTFIIILFLSFLNAVTELLGIGLIYPILTNISGNEFSLLDYNFQFLKFLNPDNYITYLFIFFLIVYFLKFVIYTLLVYLKSRYGYNLAAEISYKNLDYFISQDFLSSKKSNSSKVIQTLRTEANLFSFGVIWPIIELIINLIIMFSISLFLLIYNFYISLSVILLFIAFFGIWNLLSSKYLVEVGKKRQMFQTDAVNEIQKTFWNFKEIRIFNLKKIFLDKYQIPNQSFAKIGAIKDTVIQMPRLLLELTIVIGIVLIFIILKNYNFSNNEILITLGIFGFASIRLIAPLTKTIKSIQDIKFNSVAIDTIYGELQKYHKLKNLNNFSLSRDVFNKIKFDNLSLSYDIGQKNILNNINFEIQKGDKIGILGKTGSGKTTFINLLLGLLRPSSGKILLNKSNNEISTIYDKIGFVSQNIFLLNESVYYNVTFKKGVPEEDKKFIELIKSFELYEHFANSKLKFDTILSEKGTNLSGGQIQRLGIARALYRNPKFLLLDEATSALDLETENKVIEYIFNQKNIETIVLISHRNSVFKYCSKVYEIKNGNIINTRI
tara:strand:+ start:25105 stop:26820 length:1716 start_codon:yes stop_codon:yes gene_type:complete